MDRAMQLALERCPKSDDAVVEARRAIKREIFCQGYAAAKNTIALTWEDIRLIDELMLSVGERNLREGNNPSDEQKYTEILKLFNEHRKK